MHIASFLSYQTPWPQEQFPANNTVIRFLGFSPLALSPQCGNSTDNREIVYNRDVNWDSYLNPLAILLCYYTLVITSRLILNNQVRMHLFSQIHIVLRTTNILYTHHINFNWVFFSLTLHHKLITKQFAHV